jgi:hypothetical protein
MQSIDKIFLSFCKSLELKNQAKPAFFCISDCFVCLRLIKKKDLRFAVYGLLKTKRLIPVANTPKAMMAKSL